MFKGCIAGALLLALGACASTSTVVDRGIDAAVQAKDTEARALLNALCAMGIGALARLNSDDLIEGTLQICANKGVTLQDLEEAKGEE